jgi:hypothetical protein
LKKYNHTNSDQQQQHRVKRKPYRSSNSSVNLNEETIRSSPSGNLTGVKKYSSSGSHGNNGKTKQFNNSGYSVSSSSGSSGHNQYRMENDEATYPVLANSSSSADKKNESLNEQK